MRSFTCAPDCPRREPGCHGKCEKYIQEKAAYEKRKAIVDKDRYIRQYMIDRKELSLSKAAKRKIRFGRFKQSGRS
jgi:hypothetical protein